MTVHRTFEETTPSNLTHVDEELSCVVKHPLMPNPLRKVIQRLSTELPQRVDHELLYFGQPGFHLNKAKERDSVHSCTKRQSVFHKNTHSVFAQSQTLVSLVSYRSTRAMIVRACDLMSQVTLNHSMRT